ncbi:alpha-galactosidase/alpha-n-acetylgalactosaminidase [Diplocarpon rosae]|nr:alpha-galactosidase/alpha-n-acetylgalactosaminidase [Diplocarpon rosae]
MASRSIVYTAAAALLASQAMAVNNGLAVTPQMGWDNWNALGCDVSEDLLVETANLIVDYGLKDLGYHYVVLDDCWSTGRNASNNNSLVADAAKFPRGMAAVADDLHALGFGFGMYSSAGKYTCGRYAGSLGYEEVDAQTWADWGVDYLKYDNCYNEGQAGNQQISESRYEKMANALNATGRPILYSLCNWGEDYPWNWGSTIANSWRISGDVFDYWDTEGADAWNCGLPGFHCSITNIMNKASFIVSKAEPGGWNDLDMLEVGNGAMTDTEYVSHFSIFVDSGPAGQAPQIQMSWEVRDLWANRMSNETAAAIISASSATGNATTGYNATRVGGDTRYNATATSYKQGLAEKNELLLGNVTTTVQPSGTISASIEPHGVAMYRLRYAGGGALRKRDEL